MTNPPTRRRVLAGVAGTIGAATVAGAMPSTVTADECDQAATVAEELEARRDRLESLRSSMDQNLARVKDRKHRIMELVAESQDHQFDAAMRNRALELGRQVRDSVMMLDVTYDYGAAHATGWFHEDGHIITNAHNVDDPFNESIGYMHDGQTFEFEVLGYDEDLEPDVAVLDTDFGAPGLPIGDSSSLEKGDPLVMVGHPGGFGNWVITLGQFDHRDDGLHGVDELNTTVPVLSGNSGSPVVTLEGEVVGLLNSSRSKDEVDLRPSGAPRPSPLAVQTNLLTEDSWSSAVPIETAIERSEDWL